VLPAPHLSPTQPLEAHSNVLQDVTVTTLARPLITFSMK